MLAAEITPIAKVGGLGDVAGSLPQALYQLGADIRLCLPFYGSIDTKKYKVKKVAGEITIAINGKKNQASVWQTFLPGTRIPVYLIKNIFFDCQEIYRGCKIMKNNRYVDDANDLERFSFFMQASLEAVKKIGFKPDIIHLNDWHTALVPQLIKSPENKIFFKNTKTIYTIHNLANQGITKENILKFANLDSGSPLIKTDSENGDINFMVQGILGADAVTTVSPTYAKEIMTAQTGAGLEKILKMRGNDLYGILNGVDTVFFNPLKDKLIKQNYSLKTLDKKVANKLFLQKKLGLPENKDIPMVGFIARFVWQKGIDLINGTFSGLKCQFVFLGTGDKKYEDSLKALAKKYPSQFSAQIKFDARLAQEIYAGSDIFIIPSRFEPCGLTQMIAMRYGAVPVVRSTGGLADTVDESVGFVFKKFTSRALYVAIKKAVDGHRNKKKWRAMQVRGMKKNFSWESSAKKYLDIYKKLTNN